MFVSNTGDICPAGFLPLVVGNVRNDRVADIYRNAPLFRSLHDPTQFEGRCGFCEYRALCGGSRARAYGLLAIRSPQTPSALTNRNRATLQTCPAPESRGFRCYSEINALVLVHGRRRTIELRCVGPGNRRCARGHLSAGFRARRPLRPNLSRPKREATPELLEALSWLGRGELDAGQYDRADRYAAETRKLALEALAKRKMDDERHLPIALGASIEVHAQVLAARGERGESLAFLQRELAAYPAAHPSPRASRKTSTC